MRGLLHTTFLAGPLQQADVSFVMEENGRPFLSHQPHIPLIPASNMKLIISAAALLEKDKQKIFPPLLTYRQGSVSNGVLNGNLIIDSCGSLIFSARFPVNNNFKKKNEQLSKQITKYAEQLKKSGIREISGDIKLSFDRWNAVEENAHYTAAAAFSFNENTVDTLIKNEELSTVPQKPLVFKFEKNSAIENQDKVKNNLIRYNAKVDSRDYWRISHSPAVKYALSMLKKGLQENGIMIHQKEINSTIQKVKLFQSESIENVEEFIKPLNKHSDNFRAELLALLLNRSQCGKAAYTGLNKSIKSILKENDLGLKSLNVDDGSGLSRKNKVSASDLNTILKFMIKGKSFKSFLASMSVAGKSGTLKRRFTGTVWENSFYGKTGTLNGVSALSGYWIKKNKAIVSFSFIGNGAENELFWDALEKFAASLGFMA